MSRIDIISSSTAYSMRSSFTQKKGKQDMQTKKKVVDEILAVRQRRMSDLPSAELFLRLVWLENAYENRDKDNKELLKYFPIAIVACLETFFRLTIKKVVDSGEPYLSNSQKIMQKNNVGFDFLKAFSRRWMSFSRDIRKE